MSRGVWARLVALVAILVIGFSYIVFSVLQVSPGAQPFPVTLELPRSGGLFTGSFVAYRGVDIGRVTAIRLVPGGLAVTMRLQPGSRVPVRSAAMVHDLSAVGEQYVDLVPHSSSGPYLTSGSVIRSGTSQEPLPISAVLNDASALSNSVDTVQLDQLLKSVSTALGGTGPQLHAILVAGETLARTLGQAQGPTRTVIDRGQTLLDTARSTNPDLAQFSTNLDGLTAQLQASDSDIQALITNGSRALPQLDQLLATNQAALDQLTQAGTVVAGVAASNNAAVQALLAALPGTLAKLSSVVRDGAIQSIFYYNDEQPVCTYVTNPADFPEPTATHSTLTLGRTCTSKAPNLLQRGAAQAPEASK